MQKYEVIGRVARFAAGFILALTDEQAGTRARRLRRVEAGFEVLEAVEFKRGEVVGVLAGEIGKGILAEIRAEDAATADPDQADPPMIKLRPSRPARS